MTGKFSPVRKHHSTKARLEVNVDAFQTLKVSSRLHASVTLCLSGRPYGTGGCGVSTASFDTMAKIKTPTRVDSRMSGVQNAGNHFIVWTQVSRVLK